MRRYRVLRRLQREAEREDAVFTVLALFLLTVMLVCLIGGFVMLLTNPPAQW
jgi:nitrate reductase NapE component